MFLAALFFFVYFFIYVLFFLDLFIAAGEAIHYFVVNSTVHNSLFPRCPADLTLQNVKHAQTFFFLVHACASGTLKESCSRVYMLRD